MKFGGTSLAGIGRIKCAARHIERECAAGQKVVVVTSAMAGVTDKLIGWMRELSCICDLREYDSVISSGEQVTSGLLSIALQELGISARSWQGWQIPVITDELHGAAHIEKIDGHALHESLNQGHVAVIAGFQGVTPSGRISTLGRGGSDTSAVAIAAALSADRCDIYTDVDGVYTSDPRIVSRACRLDRISYEEMLEFASLGAKVLQTRSVEMAMKYRVPICVRSSFAVPDTFALLPVDGSSFTGTLVCDEDEIMEKQIVSGVTHSMDEAKITLIGLRDKPGISARVFGSLAAANISVDMIVQTVSGGGERTDMTFTVPVSDFDRAMQIIGAIKSDIGYDDLLGSSGIAKISVIGVGMRSHAGVAVKMFKALAELGINIQAITTSEIKISVLIDSAFVELATRVLHSTYGLDSKKEGM